MVRDEELGAPGAYDHRGASLPGVIAPPGTGDRGTSFYYRWEAEEHARGALDAATTEERDTLNAWSAVFDGLADVREGWEQQHAEEAGMDPNRAAAHDLQFPLEASEGYRQRIAEELGFDHKEAELGEMAREREAGRDLEDDFVKGAWIGTIDDPAPEDRENHSAEIEEYERAVEKNGGEPPPRERSRRRRRVEPERDDDRDQDREIDPF